LSASYHLKEISCSIIRILYECLVVAL